MELTKVVRQKDKLLIDLVNKVRVGNNDYDVEILLKVRFIHKSEENYPKDALHMYVENKLTIKRNEAVLNDLPSRLYTTEIISKTPDNCKYPLAAIQAAHNQKQTKIGLEKLLK